MERTVRGAVQEIEGWPCWRITYIADVQSYASELFGMSSVWDPGVSNSQLQLSSRPSALYCECDASAFTLSFAVPRRL